MLLSHHEKRVAQCSAECISCGKQSSVSYSVIPLELLSPQALLGTPQKECGAEERNRNDQGARKCEGQQKLYGNGTANLAKSGLKCESSFQTHDVKRRNVIFFSTFEEEK